MCDCGHFKIQKIGLQTKINFSMSGSQPSKEDLKREDMDKDRGKMTVLGEKLTCWNS